ncbi:MAG: acyltransferase [Alphaproteobacteria bacterium]|nr:acyltransferase [Alphaproteobacteria bacterium]
MTTRKPSETYRPDIDGLRAIAVLSVLGYHAVPEWIRGGFVGVDVFFVISGYLITTGLLETLRDNRFSLLDFYERRICRIFPALITVLVICFAFGWFTLFAQEYEQLGKHTAGGAGFVSNLVLLADVGYFDNAAETKPLLHLWSLGIEEQYYAIWPLILWATWRFRLKILPMIVSLLAISFFFNVYHLEHRAQTIFYLPQSRAWELLAGSLLAGLEMEKAAVVCARTRLALSLAGMAAILLAIAILTSQSLFPGWWAILPVLGAASLIAAGQAGLVNRTILSSRPMVAIGLISYPLYLWHWPLLSFARILSGEEPALPVRILLAALAIVLASLTYRFIEKPIRFGRLRRIRLGPVSAAMASLSAAMLAIGILGYGGFANKGFASRASATPAELRVGDIGPTPYFQYLKQRYYPCPSTVASHSLEFEGVVRCFQSRADEQVDFALIGDSHAEQLFLGLAEELPNRNVIFLIRSGLPIRSNETFSDIFSFVLKTQSIRTVIITSRWSTRIRETPAGQDFTTELARTLATFRLAGKNVFLTDDFPTFNFDPEICKYQRGLTRSHCTISIDNANSERSTFLRMIAAAADREQIPVLKTWHYLCRSSDCSMTLGNQILYRDRNHLNIVGSKHVATLLLHDYPLLQN